MSSRVKTTEKRKTYRVFFNASGYVDIESRNRVAAEAAFEEMDLEAPGVTLTSSVIEEMTPEDEP